MGLSSRLQTNLTDESKAYGYTLVIWGSGAILIDTFGFPGSVQVATYILGAVVGFGILAIAVYGSVFRRVTSVKDEAMIVASTIHFIAALGTIGLSGVLVSTLPELWGYFLTGVNATVTYNLLLLVESAFSAEIAAWENR